MINSSRYRYIPAILLAICCVASVGFARAEPITIEIAAGNYFIGSSAAQRDIAYNLDEAAYGHSITRDQKWYDNEPPLSKKTGHAFRITRSQITNRQYFEFVRQNRYPAPDVTSETWRGYGLIHPYTRTRRHAWQNGEPPTGREDHPVVLVSYKDASAYAAWLTKTTGQTWRLPTEHEWERAARGDDGRMFPWGDHFDAALLNSHDQGPFDTLPVGLFPNGHSPHGLVDAAGQVFEWTATAAGARRHIVKGGSWDDKGCGVCRPAARHSRPDHLKHILIGFRLIRE
jgi:formylglycine-generating enzyme required for sulfatase activity